MQIEHSDAFCGSFFSLKACTKLNHEKTERQFFTLVPAGSTRKTSIRRNFFKFLFSKSDGFVIFKGASQKFAIFSQNLDFSVGFSHNIVFQIPNEVKVTAETEKGKPPVITLTSHDKQLLGSVASKIRSFRKPEPYKGKGIRYVDEYVRRKAGKTAAS